MTIHGLMLWGVLGLMLVAAVQRETKPVAPLKPRVVARATRRRRR